MPKHTIISTIQPRVKRQNTSPSTPKYQANMMNSITPVSINEDISQFQHDYELAVCDVWNLCGSCALSMGSTKLAISSYDCVLKRSPDNLISLIGLSKALKLNDDRNGIKQSIDILSNALERFPRLANEVLIWKELGELHFEIQQYETAHQYIARALQLHPTDATLLYLIGRIFIKLGQLDYSIQTLQASLRILKHQESNSEVLTMIRSCHEELAHVYTLEGNYKAATNELQTALSESSRFYTNIKEYESIWASLVSIREKANDVDDALKVCDDAISMMGFVPRILISKAYLLLLPNTKNFDPVAAIPLLKSAINQEANSMVASDDTHKNPDHGDFLSWYLLGRAYSLLDSSRQAYDALQVALRRGPTSPLPWLAVGALYLRLGQLGDALAAYSQAARLQPGDSQASAYSSAAAWEGLACVYERCDSQARDAADACLRAAGCFKAAGDERAAAQAEQRAHSLTAAARGDAPVPSMRGLLEPPASVLRELVASSPEHRTSLQYQQQEQKLQQAQQAQQAQQIQQIQQAQQAQQVQQVQQVQPLPLLPPQQQPPQQFHNLAILRNTPETELTPRWSPRSFSSQSTGHFHHQQMQRQTPPPPQPQPLPHATQQQPAVPVAVPQYSYAIPTQPFPPAAVAGAPFAWR